MSCGHIVLKIKMTQMIQWNRSSRERTMCEMCTRGAIAVFSCLLLIVNGCENPSFHNTSVTVVGVRGIDTVNGCLEPDGILEKASYVQIINQSIPILYHSAVQNLPNLEDLILESNGIREIRSGAFYNVPKLKLLRMKYNDIHVITVGIFNNLTISELNLKNNNISSIEDGAFDYMPQLTILHLDHNKLSTWSGTWFFESPQLSTLSLKSNMFTTIPSAAFRNIKGLHLINGRNVTTNIYLDDNKIEFIDPNALEGLNMLGWLFLSKNQLVELDERLLDPLSQIDWLKLSSNKLPCVPDKTIAKIPTVVHYLDGNPLSAECKAKIAKKN